ncbi:MAG: DUF6538 domain-containing protein [Caulobacterales bacterium]|uniref:DUF6538 domain-containing protein n=1 Tax=Glycocaulis sp. TaxID=1969725 RepID=UPI003F9ED799
MNHYLKQRGKVWYLRMRVPLDVREKAGREWIEESLRTRDVQEARRRRDTRKADLEREWELIRRVGDPSAIERTLAEAELERQWRNRGELPAAAPTVAERLSEELSDAAQAWGRREGLIDRFGAGIDPEELLDRFTEETREGERLRHQLEALRGNLPIAVAGERWLAKARLTDGTKREYRRFFSTAQAKLPLPQQVTRTDARLFIQWLAEEGGEDGSGFARKTVNNHRSALSALWSYLDLDTAIWSGIRFEPAKGALKRDVWTLEEIVRLLDTAKALPGEAGEKLPRVIRIALHTGERAKELAGMRYDPENDWLVIPRDATKTDAGERALPCPDALREDVKAWVAEPWATQSVSNRFSELKKGLGFKGREKVLHSFRHTLLSRLHELGVQEATAAKIAGHKHAGMTYGTYGNKTSVESLRGIMNSLDWDARLEAERKAIEARK